jgi:hypothetical protein
MATSIGKFKASLEKMFIKLQGWIPSDPELEKNKGYIDAALRVNPRDCITIFVAYMKPFSHEIMKGNDSFILQSDATALATEEYFGLFERLKKIWTELEDSKRKEIKKFLKLLFMLGVIVTRDEELRLIINQYREKNNPLLF